MSHSLSSPQPPGQPPVFEQTPVRSEYMQKATWRRPSATWGQAMKLWWKNLLVFHGRASRSEYWWMMLSLVVASLILGMGSATIELAVSGSQGVSADSFSESAAPTPAGVVVNILSFVLSLSMIPLSVRRMHDINRSGWWVLVFQVLSFIASIIAAVALVFLVLNLDAAAEEAGQASPNIGGPLAGILVACALGLGVMIWSIVWHAMDSKAEGTRYDLEAPRLPEPQHANWAPANPAFAHAQHLAHAQNSAPAPHFSSTPAPGGTPSHRADDRTEQPGSQSPGGLQR